MEFDLLYQEIRSGEQTAFARDLQRDLKLSLLLNVMSGGDKAVYDACAAILSNPLEDLESIRLRSEVVRDAIAHPEAFEALAATASETLARFQRLSEYAKPKYDKVVSTGSKIVLETEIAKVFLQGLATLKALLAKRRHSFLSAGMLKLCSAVQDTLGEDYLSRIQARVEELSVISRGGFVQISGHMGEGFKYTDVVLNRICAPAKKNRVFPAASCASIPLGSVTLQQNAEELTEKALLPVFRIIAAFNKGVRHFFDKLDFQLKFFTGCARLSKRFSSLCVPMCTPEFTEDGHRHEAMRLVDAGLAIKEDSVPMSNDLTFAHQQLVIITGPNQGGKTTFLRSIGLAQVMAQCGMLVTAKEYLCPVYKGIFTHFPNGEDAHMQKGLLEVELSRLSVLTYALHPGSLLLMNESFQTTTSGDAKHLAEQIVPALCEAGVMVVFVTHLYEYAKELYDRRPADVQFLKAQRSPDGLNTYCMQEGEPFRTAFGLSLFDQVMREAV